jgi:hypothetical protein
MRLRTTILIDSCVAHKQSSARHRCAPAKSTQFKCSGNCAEVGAWALATSLLQLQRFCIDASGIVVFTAPLRKRWQEASPGLKFYDDYLPSTSYFERMLLTECE